MIMLLFDMREHGQLFVNGRKRQYSSAVVGATKPGAAKDNPTFGNFSTIGSALDSNVCQNCNFDDEVGA